MRARGEEELLRRGLDHLSALLGESWEVTPLHHGAPTPSNIRGERTADLVVSIKDPSGYVSGPVLVEVGEALTPREVTSRLRPRADLLQRVSPDAALLVISSWLSPRTREVLESLGYGYLDLTGNIAFRLSRPGIVIRTVGNQRDPTPRKSYVRQLRGDKAGALVRAMIDVRPPYRVTELAGATGLSLSYVSRLVDAMDSEGLLTRQSRLVADVDWQALLRARSAHYELLVTNPPVAMVAPQGVDKVRPRLAELGNAGPDLSVAITGHEAVRHLVPLAAPGGQLMVHVYPAEGEEPARLGRQLGLIPAQSNRGQVLLLRTASPMTFTSLRYGPDGAPEVALSQLALDLFGGTGRMPAEGEALVEYMAADDTRWRLDDLAQWRRPTPLG